MDLKSLALAPALVAAVITGGASGVAGGGSQATSLRFDPDISTNPTPLWGPIACAKASRVRYFETGGPTGGPYRRLRARDGDRFYGERCELGNNERRYGLGGPKGTFSLYREGDQAVTSLWMRLPSSFPIATRRWQVVLQMKETQPYVAASGPESPILSLEVRDGHWCLATEGRIKWVGPRARRGAWTPITLDVTYSMHASRGRVQLTIGSVASPAFEMPTLAYVTHSGDGLSVGDPIASHLRVGIYHDRALPGTWIDVADVAVVRL